MRDRWAWATLGLVALIGVGIWLVFPRVQAWVRFQDCAAAGRVDCGP